MWLWMHSFYITLFVWFFVLGLFVNSFVISRMTGLRMRYLMSFTVRSHVLSSLFAIAFAYFVFQWVLPFLIAMKLLDIYFVHAHGMLLNFIGTYMIYYLGITALLSDYVQDDQANDLQWWLLLVHVICGSVVWFGMNRFLYM